MSMAEESRPQSIQERIAALNQAHIGLVPDAVTPSASPSRPAAPRARSVNNPPHKVVGSVVDNKSIGNRPAPLRENGLLPPPTITRNGANTAGTNGVNGSKPPLPTRKSSQPAPTLPPRSSSTQVERRPSTESIRSSTSFSTTSTSGTASTADTRATSLENGKKPLRAPAWGETKLPALPPRNANGPKSPSRPKPISSSSVERLRNVPLPVRPSIRPELPSRRPSSESRDTNRSLSPPPPPLPLRRQLSTEQAPKLPTRPGGQSTNGNSDRPTVRKLPPVPSVDAIDKIRQSTFAGLNKRAEEIDPARPLSNGHSQNLVASDAAPLPVPLTSRPDITALQATKPKLNPSSSSTSCLVCRDFSGPDIHAAQFPRQSLPTNDLAWLANQLTAPFPSLTDKARAIFTWLHHNISYDVDAFFNNRVQPSTPQKTLETGLAVCEGYAGLLVTLASHAGLEAIVIRGHGKGFGHVQLAPGAPLPPFSTGHAWNAVRIDGGQWKLVDPCWGSGAIQGTGMPYIKRFDPTNFTKSNDEFGLTHFPSNKEHFFRDDGRPSISWEEYIRGGGNHPQVFGPAKEDNGISELSFLPAKPQISVHQAGPMRFQFSLMCEHWTVRQHNKKSGPYIFLLLTHGIDGRKDDHIPFNHVPGNGPNGGGDFWYLDIADPRTLGAPGQKLPIGALTSFGAHQDARGLTMREYQNNVGRVGWGMSFMAEWELVV